MLRVNKVQSKIILGDLITMTTTPPTTRSQKLLSSSDTLTKTRTALTMAENQSPTAAIPQLQRLQDSLNSVLAIVKQNGETMTTITDDIHGIKEDVTDIKEVTNEAEGMKEQLYATQGKVSRLESKNVKLEEKVLSLESQLYQKDLM